MIEREINAEADVLHVMLSCHYTMTVNEHRALLAKMRVWAVEVEKLRRLAGQEVPAELPDNAVRLSNVART